MESISKSLKDRFEELKQRGEKNKGKEYKTLYLRMSYAIAKDEHIRKIGTRSFAIFIVIRTFMDKEGVAYPSLRRIAYLSGCSIRTVQKEINNLISHRWVEKANRIRHWSGKYGNTKYRILQKDLIRGSGQLGFIDEPLAETAIGD